MPPPRRWGSRNPCACRASPIPRPPHRAREPRSGAGGATTLDQLTDVTIGGGPPGIPLTVGQVLRFEADSQWRNIDNPFGLLDSNNVWTGYQDYTAVADPGAPVVGIGRFFVETLDANNDGLFVYLNQAGVVTKVRLA